MKPPKAFPDTKGKDIGSNQFDPLAHDFVYVVTRTPLKLSLQPPRPPNPPTTSPLKALMHPHSTCPPKLVPPRTS